MTLERLGHQHHCQRKETLQGRKARTAGSADEALKLSRRGEEHTARGRERLRKEETRTAGYADAALKLERRGEEHPARGWERFARGRLGLEAWMMPRGRDRGTMGRWVQKNMPTDGRNTRFPRYRVLQYGKFFPSSMSPFQGGTVPLHRTLFPGSPIASLCPGVAFPGGVAVITPGDVAVITHSLLRRLL